ncbi:MULTISPECIES: outer membrane protein transport protein [unclassified Shewanella]|uniref:OmpP1/FadL family transporter n=1 Tax=unclassified Shewanella TaxID=196818 RepID=UPI000C84A6E0|nr:MULTISPECIES: outer membrane protein transport protein [unclassified Shewanella]PMG31102.1 aromatic hydrocarbon degradation protein [Shewanella sp. 10N.286.52.C2]PMG51777.1 aromatic hydrocarbon degradation protein [Shewanella sp. 10N.286.52.B9]
MTKFNKTLLAAAVALASTQTFAAGFQLNSQSATGLGRAMAGDAIIADNASVLARNPAAMALFDKTAISVVGTYADVNVEVTDAMIGDGSGDGQYLGAMDNAAEGKPIPSFYYINPINDKWAFGVAAFSNYGTGTDLAPLNSGHDFNTPIDLLGNTEVTTINFNASVSYRINDSLSLGLGIDAIKGMGTLTRQGDFTVPVFGEIPLNLVDIDADGWGFGAIFGLAYEINENNRIGLSYRKSPNMKASGDIAYNPPFAAENFGEIDIPLADIAQLAGFHQLTDKFAIHYTAQWTNWSNFDNIELTDGENGTDSHILKHYNWENSWFLSLGATYDINDKWTVRAGIAKDQGVVGEVSSLSIPDSDRTWYSAGFSYHINEKSSIDFGYTLVAGEKVHVIETSELVGPVSAYTESGANYYSLQYNYTF